MNFRLIPGGHDSSAKAAFDLTLLADQVPAHLVGADLDMKIVYLNRASRESLTRLPAGAQRLFRVGSDELLRSSARHSAGGVAGAVRRTGDPSLSGRTIELSFGDQVLRVHVEVMEDTDRRPVGYSLVWDCGIGRDRQAQAATGELVEIATATSTAASEVAASSSQSSAQAALVATASEEMSASIAEIAEQVGQAAAATSRGLAASLDVNASMAALSSSTADIAGLVRFIESVASQTNLLALNATIEAARAGESGRGFAVVAAEVKSLAQQVSNATGEIRAKVDAIQSDTAAAGTSLHDMSAVVREINDLQSGIAAAVEQQSATSSEISRNISVVAEASRRLNDVASSLQDMAGSVERRAGELRALLTSA